MQLRLLRAEADTKNPISEAPSPNPQAPSSSAPRRRRSRRSESATVASRSPSLTSERPPASACRIRSNALKWRRRHRHRRWTRVSGDKSHCGLLLPANQRLLMMNPTSFPRSNWHFDFLFSFLKFFYWFLVCVCVCRYEILDEFFDRLDTLVSLHRLKRWTPTFTSISSRIESLTDRYHSIHLGFLC